MRLHGYWRSSTSYRLRIALGLKGLEYEQVAVNLLDGEQRSREYRRLNPYGGVPALEIDGRIYAQSMAILEWLDESFPDRPLLPRDIEDRFASRELSLAIATELHAPLNLPVLKYLKNDLGHAQDEVDDWYRHWIARTFESVETRLAQRLEASRGAGDFLFDAPGLFECVLVPQLYNARRFSCDLSAYPHLTRIDTACREHPAFIAAHPDRQPDRN
ncbi:maleylacetoacetate isomerase [Novosphingobium sp. PhB57]|uniref:maleylacetoacetate isomerase n=1 Tax=Novosphingobium sp. PhB57 TaxID=2485107 RepID=UPI001047ACCF|nr:maleylacetoacetate isomerase [Novosphingobium sp. PhB57]TCU59935.1 maleylacetoacetate isomerase [Novosphingobium sp. PhB57]